MCAIPLPLLFFGKAPHERIKCSIYMSTEKALVRYHSCLRKILQFLLFAILISIIIAKIVTFKRVVYNEVFMANIRNRISQATSKSNNLDFDAFKATLNETIQRHAPKKQRYVCANQTPFINETI